MIVRDHGAGGRWFVEARSYPTALMAKKAWERAESRLDLSAGDQGIGITRLGPNPERGRSAGAPHGGHLVVLVTLDYDTARKARGLLGDGTAWDPAPDFADALILRRMRVMADHAGHTGRTIVRRPEGRGAKLDAEGRLREQRGEG